MKLVTPKFFSENNIAIMYSILQNGFREFKYKKFLEKITSDPP